MEQDVVSDGQHNLSLLHYISPVEIVERTATMKAHNTV